MIMGQITTGLMLGREHEYDEDAEKDLEKAKISYSVRPDRDEGGSYSGFLYAVSRGSETGCAFMDSSMPVSEIPDAFPKHKAKARARWDKFAALVKAKCTNKTLLAFVNGEPEIILVQTEVG
jgi:hypothetical protein